MTRLPLFLAPVLLSACASATGTGEQTAPFDGIAANETVYFVGTEPFWGGETSGESLTYTTPDNIDGATIAVRRFAGNVGIGVSGTLEGQAFDMTVTPGECSDGMSDAAYPLTITLSIAEDQREGCGWTDRLPRTGGEAG
jgi:uncharacterized membrane protein